MDQDKKEKVARALQERGVRMPCPRCASTAFEVVGQTLLILQDDLTVMTIGGPAVPAVLVACSNCGFVTHHALGPLGLLPTLPREGDKS